MSLASLSPATTILAAGAIADLSAAWRQPREPRIAHRVPCQVRLSDAEAGSVVVVAGETVNLSPRGVAVHLGRIVPIGATVQVLLSSLEGEPAFLYGRVVHSRRVLTGTYEIGIAVTDEFRPA